MTTLLQFILILLIFLPVRFFTYKLTNEWGLPAWLDYKPWSCDLCLSFWSLVTIYTAIWLSFSCLYTGAGGITLAVLNAIAMYLHQKNNTISIEDYDKIIND